MNSVSDGGNYNKTQILIWCVFNVLKDTMIVELRYLIKFYRR